MSEVGGRVKRRWGEGVGGREGGKERGGEGGNEKEGMVAVCRCSSSFFILCYIPASFILLLALISFMAALTRRSGSRSVTRAFWRREGGREGWREGES